MQWLSEMDLWKKHLAVNDFEIIYLEIPFYVSYHYAKDLFLTLLHVLQIKRERQRMYIRM